MLQVTACPDKRLCPFWLESGMPMWLKWTGNAAFYPARIGPEATPAKPQGLLSIIILRRDSPDPLQRKLGA